MSESVYSTCACPHQVRDLCETDKCKLMTTLELKQFVYSLRSVSNASKPSVLIIRVVYICIS